MLVDKQLSIAAALYLTFSASAVWAAGAAWRDASHRATLSNKVLEASFQAGFLYELKDLRSGGKLLSAEPAKLPAVLPVFGSFELDLNACKVKQEVSKDSVTTRFQSPNGTQWTLRWRIEPDAGDLVLQSSGQTPKPVDQFRLTLPGCRISDHNLVWIDVYGVSQVVRGPWQGVFGDPAKAGFSRSFCHPLVTLFEGAGAGWFVEGREDRIAPANLIVKGRGGTAELTFVRGFPAKPTKTPQMFEIRLRAYQGNWADAVDPYLAWMEKGAGFSPIGTGHHPKWVKDIQVQSYVRVGDFEGLKRLAQRVDPARTFVGRMVGWRKYPMDTYYPDYTPAKEAVPWFRRARELGFHVGAHFNSQRLSADLTDLVDRFRPAFYVKGKDAQGNDVYEGIDRQGSPKLISVSAAYKPWRDYLIKQARAAVEAGVDVVYLDESMAPGGKYVIDGVTGTEGVMLLMKEMGEAYPGVAIETEQFNPMTARYSSFALSQMPLGHPLSGYIFHRFIHVVPEGVMGAPLGEPMMDAFACWGFMLPGLMYGEDSWSQIARAFQDYGLVPDPRLEHALPRSFGVHYTHGWFPAYGPAPADGLKLFGYRGKKGVTAYFEKQPNKRGLVIYQPGKQPQWVGTRVTGVRKWSGPGVLKEYIPGVDVMSDWLIYDRTTQLALDPKKSYIHDPAASLPAGRFHVTAVPDDFALFKDDHYRVEAQYVGPENSWFKINFSGHGEITMFVPDDVLVFLDGREVAVDRPKKTARATIDTAADKPSNLIAFRRSEVILAGPWKDLPWQVPREQRSWYVGQHVRMEYPSDGPLLQAYAVNGFYCHVGGWGLMVGRLPKARSITLQGAYTMLPETTGSIGDGVIRVNGKEVVRVPGGPAPFRVRTFEADLTELAGQYVMIEFASEGRVGGAGPADWYNPQIIVGP